MVVEKLWQKSRGFIAFFFVLVFLALAMLYVRYLYFFLAVAAIAFVYGCRQFKKRDTPFERHERELRRKTL